MGTSPASEAPCTLFCPRKGCNPVPGPSDLAANEGERDQATRVVRAVDVLRDAHAPEDDGRLRTRIAARHRAQGLRRDAADRRHLLRRELLDLLGKGFEIRGLCLDILPVVEALS